MSNLFTTTEDNQIHVIQCPAAIDSNASQNFKDLSKSWLLLPSNIHVLDFKKTKTLSPTAYNAFINFKQLLKGGEKHMYSINLGETLLWQIKNAGVEKIFNPADSLDHVRSQTGESNKKAKTIDVKFINPFIEATISSLKVQASTNATPKKMFLKTASFNPDISIAGNIALISDKFSGSIALCFSKVTFLKIYKNMFSEEHTEITDELKDAAGEILNIIYGQAKVVLNANNENQLKKAIPTIMTGEKLKVRQLGSGPAIIVPFESDAGEFHIEIQVD